MMRQFSQISTPSWWYHSSKSYYLKFFRSTHSKAEAENKISRQCEEIEIEVPWGHLSAKWWGTKSVRPMVGIHGWLDNAGTFDTLAPLLPDHVGLLAIDWPGHGFSSRIPHGLAYNHMDNVYLLRLLMKQYKWERLSIFAHSLSSGVGLTFAAMYPDKVDMMIGIDVLTPLYRPVDNTYARLVSHMEGFIRADERNQQAIEPPAYSHEECIERLYVASEKSIDRDKCFHILDRNIRKSKKTKNKFYFNRDNRLRFFLNTISKELYAKLASKIACPYIFIKTTRTPCLEDEENFHQVLDVMRKSNPNYQYVEVNGKHHVHLNEPEKIAAVVNDFIGKHRSPAHD